MFYMFLKNIKNFINIFLFSFDNESVMFIDV